MYVVDTWHKEMGITVQNVEWKKLSNVKIFIIFITELHERGINERNFFLNRTIKGQKQKVSWDVLRQFIRKCIRQFIMHSSFLQYEFLIKIFYTARHNGLAIPSFIYCRHHILLSQNQSTVFLLSFPIIKFMAG